MRPEPSFSLIHLISKQVVVCECDLTVFESEESSLNDSTISSETPVCSTHDDEQSLVMSCIKIPETCTCFRSSSPTSESLVSFKDQDSSTDSQSEILVDRKDYLR